MSSRARVLLITPGFSHFLLARVLDVAEREDERLLLPRGERHLEAMRRDRLPAARHRIPRLAPHDDLGLVHAVVEPEERLPLGVEAGGGRVHVRKGEMIAPLAVLGLVIDGARLDLDLTRAQLRW